MEAMEAIGRQYKNTLKELAAWFRSNCRSDLSTDARNKPLKTG
jgi:hypothetical protein